jgi:hypothetical protein
MSTDIKSLGSFVWSIAELLRGDFKQSEYGKVILPFVEPLSGVGSDGTATPACIGTTDGVAGSPPEGS